MAAVIAGWRVETGVMGLLSIGIAVVLMLRFGYEPGHGLRLDSPVVWASFFAGLYAGVVPITIAIGGNAVFLERDLSESLSQATLVGFAAMAGLGIGAVASVPERRIPVSSRPEFDLDRLGRWTMAIGAVGTLLWIVIGGIPLSSLNALAEDSSYGQYIGQSSGVLLDYLGYFRFTLVAGAALYTAAAHRRHSYSAASIGWLLIVGSMLTGLRFPTAAAVGSVAILLRPHRPIPVRTIVATAAVVLLAFAYVAINRTSSATQVTAGSAADVLAGGTDIIRPFAAVVESAQGRPLLLGSSYLYLVAQVVPRAVWLSKPAPPTMVRIWEATDVTSGWAIPLYGEAYLNFGIAGTGLLSAASGFAVGRWHRRIRSSGVTVVTALLLPMIGVSMSRSLFVQGVYISAFWVGPTIAVQWWWWRGRRSRVITAAPSRPSSSW